MIAAAALIMISVFGSFILNGDPTVKQFGVGLAVGVLARRDERPAALTGAARARLEGELVGARTGWTRSSRTSISRERAMEKAHAAGARKRLQSSGS